MLFSTGVYHWEESPPFSSIILAMMVFAALLEVVAPEMLSTARDWDSIMRG